MALERYREKRQFDKTPEPAPCETADKNAPRSAAFASSATMPAICTTIYGWKSTAC